MSFRKRYGFYRDLEGACVEGTLDIITVKAVTGRPVVNLFPPDFNRDLLRPDYISAGEIAADITESHRVGITLLEHSKQDSLRSRYAGVFYSTQLTEELSFYAEWAAAQPSSGLQAHQNKPEALYASVNYNVMNGGLSLEYKRYDWFLLGSGFNDPPALIKEHTYPVLNRQTHVLFANGEQGFQAEAYYTWASGSMTTLNGTALRTFNGLEAVYREVFLEHQWKSGSIPLKLFYDFAIDEPKFQGSRHSAGFSSTVPAAAGFFLTADVQAQQFESKTFNEVLRNGYLAVTASRGSGFSVGAVAEISGDWNVTDKPQTLEVEKSRTWLALNASVLVKEQHRFQLFAGRRRGGPACTSGVCYEVQDFNGFELNYSLHF